MLIYLFNFFSCFLFILSIMYREGYGAGEVMLGVTNWILSACFTYRIIPFLASNDSALIYDSPRVPRMPFK